MSRYLLAAFVLLGAARAFADVAPPTVAAEPAPAPLRWALDLSLGASYVTDRSFDYISGDDVMTVGDLRVGYVPGWADRHVELDLGYMGTTETGDTFGSVHTALSVRSLQPGVLYRRTVLGPLDVYGRAAFLLDFDRLELSSQDEALHLRQNTMTEGALIAAGAEVIAARWPRAQLGFTMELGYAQRFTQAKFDSMTPDVGDPKPAPVAFTPVNAGSVDLSGIQWRLGASVHF